MSGRTTCSLAAEAAFRARLGELGAELLEPVWLGSQMPHLVRCAAGHEVRPRPTDILKGRGACRFCARRSKSVTVAAAFRARLAELGAELLEPVWLGVNVAHRVRCAAGHDCAPRPHNVLKGRGICITCAGQNPALTEAAFRARLGELGAELLESEYFGNKMPHRVRCAAGHDCAPRPNGVLSGQGICLTCVGNDPGRSAAAFRARLGELGAELLEPVWLGVNVAHRVRCAAGHLARPRPSNVLRGHGVCHTCSGMIWDVFYVVADQAAGRVKFGITSGDPRPRLGAHRAAGYRERVLVLEGLPGMVAPEIESAAIAALALAGVRPIKGREYYDAEAALAVVLDIAESWPREVIA